MLRDPEDDGAAGQGGDGRVCYRLLPEGTIQNYDGALVPLAPDIHGLDLNRNYPMEWRPEGDQHGAGPYPTSEPEIAAEVAAITERRNITVFVAYHTYGGLYLRPYSAHADDTMPTADLRAYTKIGRKATELTGYPALSVFHDFLYHPKVVETGASDDWAYDHLGVFAWTVEIWSPMRQAGITDYKPIDWFREHPVADDLAILRWNDEVLGDEGFVDWCRFEHPQLGPVELGGFPLIQPWSNPPFSKLEAEIAPHAEMMIHHLLISPLLHLRSAEALAVGPGVWKVRVVVENAGWLPTNVTEKAVERKAVRPLEAEIALPDGAELVSGDQRVELGQLTGRAAKTTPMDALSGTFDPTKDRAKAEWIVRIPVSSPVTAAPSVTVTIRHDRAGTIHTDIALGCSSPLRADLAPDGCLGSGEQGFGDEGDDAGGTQGSQVSQTAPEVLLGDHQVDGHQIIAGGQREHGRRGQAGEHLAQVVDPVAGDVQHHVAVPAGVEHGFEAQHQVVEQRPRLTIGRAINPGPASCGEVGRGPAHELGLAGGDHLQGPQPVGDEAGTGLAQVDDGVGQPGRAHPFERAAHGHDRDGDAQPGEVRLGVDWEMGGDDAAPEIVDGVPSVIGSRRHHEIGAGEAQREAGAIAEAVLAHDVGGEEGGIERAGGERSCGVAWPHLDALQPVEVGPSAGAVEHRGRVAGRLEQGQAVVAQAALRRDGDTGSRAHLARWETFTSCDLRAR